MTQPAMPFQELLTSAYAEEAERYTRALQMARELQASFQRGGTGEENLQQIMALLNEVALIEARITDAKQAWQASGQKPGPQLQGVLERVTELIQSLSGHIQEAEREATEQKNRLVPELDAAVRGQQMQRAYGAYR